MTNKNNEKLREKIQKIVDSARSQDGASYALQYLFPDAPVNDTFVYGRRDTEGVDAQFRISNPNTKYDYFKLNTSSEIWSKSEVERFRETDDPLNELASAISKIEKSQDNRKHRLRVSLLEIFSHLFGERNPISPEWIKSIVFFSPYFIKEKDISGGLFTLSNFDKLRSIVVRGLLPLGGKEIVRRLSVAISDAEDISLLCDLVRLLAGDAREDGTKGRDILDLEEAHDLRNKLLVRVREIANRNGIWSQAHPQSILWFWWGAQENQEVSSWILEETKNEHSLVMFLRTMVQTVYSSSGNFDRVNRKTLENITNSYEIVSRAEKAKKSQNSDIARIAGDFLAALNRDEWGEEHPSTDNV